MFVGWYSSDGGRPGFGCFGLPLLIVPLLCMFGGFGDSSFMLLIILVGLFMLFVLPRLLSTASGPAYAESEADKRKNDVYLDKSKNDEYEYGDKPKRDDDIIVGADGEVMDIIDERDPNHTPPPVDGY